MSKTLADENEVSPVEKPGDDAAGVDTAIASKVDAPAAKKEAIDPEPPTVEPQVAESKVRFPFKG